MPNRPTHERPVHLQRLTEELDVNHRGVTLDYLAFVDVVDEALVWLAAPLTGGTTSPRIHGSLCSTELSLGLANVGPKTRDFLGARVERAEGATAVWATGSVASGVSDHSELRLALEDLRDCLSTPNGLAAVWSDLTAFYESGACEWERTERVIDFPCNRSRGWARRHVVSIGPGRDHPARDTPSRLATAARRERRS